MHQQDEAKRGRLRLLGSIACKIPESYSGGGFCPPPFSAPPIERLRLCKAESMDALRLVGLEANTCTQPRQPHYYEPEIHGRRYNPCHVIMHSRRYRSFCQVSKKTPALGNGSGSHKAYFLFNYSTLSTSPCQMNFTCTLTVYAKHLTWRASQVFQGRHFKFKSQQ